MPGTGWNRLNKSLLDDMKSRLGSEWSEFAEITDSIGLVENNFIALGEKLKGNFAVSNCATAVVSAANYYGTQGELKLSRQLAAWALMIEPHHVPALKTLQMICQLERDESGAAEYSKQEMETIERIQNKSEEDLTAFEHGILDALD